MARGIYHATMINTVSPTYAREILTPEYGERLDGLLRYRHFDVHGILNGLDYETWNPATDSHLARPTMPPRRREKLRTSGRCRRGSGWRCRTHRWCRW